MQKFHEILHHFSLTVYGVPTYGAPLVPSLQKIFFIWWPPDNMWCGGHYIAIWWPPHIIWWPPDKKYFLQ